MEPLFVGEVSPNVWRIPSHRLETAQALVAKLNSRARKCGGSVSLEVEKEETIEHEMSGGQKLIFCFTWIRLSGDVPRVSGYEFLARIEHTSVGNLISHARSSYGEDLPVAFRTAAPTCDHCKASRRRKDTFVLRSEEGQLVRVGRQCLADYLRSEDVAQALKIWKALASLKDALGGYCDEWSSSGGYGHPSTLTFLAAACSSIRHNGWVSKTVAFDTGKVSTASEATFICGPRPQDLQMANYWQELQPSDEDRKLAEEVLNWARSLPEPRSEYLHNLFVAASQEYVTHRTTGLVASAVSGYTRVQNERARAEIRKPAAGHFGEVKKRYDLGALECVFVTYVDSMYGSKAICIFIDAEGHKFKWVSTAASPERGKRYAVRGTVKQHDEYKGEPQTILTRCTIEEVQENS